jgi:hypothetical protein
MIDLIYKINHLKNNIYPEHIKYAEDHINQIQKELLDINFPIVKQEFIIPEKPIVTTTKKAVWTLVKTGEKIIVPFIHNNYWEEFVNTVEKTYESEGVTISSITDECNPKNKFEAAGIIIRRYAKNKGEVIDILKKVLNGAYDGEEEPSVSSNIVSVTKWKIYKTGEEIIIPRLNVIQFETFVRLIANKYREENKHEKEANLAYIMTNFKPKNEFEAARMIVQKFANNYDEVKTLLDLALNL